MQYSQRFRAGLIVLGVLSALDVAGPAMTDGKHPPMAIALIGTALGLASLALIAVAWRSGRAVTPLLVLRVLSAVSAAPAFFLSGVPVAAKAAAGAIVVLTVVGAGLMMSAQRSLVARGAR